MAPKARPVASTAALPTKERALFARLIQEYENKKYKLGLKTADTILKKYPEHGETLCMKGLILASLGDRAQGLEMAKTGVRKDLTSFISWHALGILNRMDKNYDEAIKCYSQALRIEGGTNLNLIRESNYMHMQTRNYPQLIEGRINILKMQPHLRTNWAALAVAYHLAGKLDEAEQTLAKWQDTCRDVPKYNYEHSEMLLYRASILLEAGQHQKVIDHLTAEPAASQIVDQRVSRFYQAQAHTSLQQKSQAESLWRQLVSENQEDRTYIQGWLQTQCDLSDKHSAEAVSKLKSLQSLFPKSQAAQRLELDYATGSAFEEAAEVYLSRALTKGVPSIFSDLKSLLTRGSDKSVIVEKVAQRLLQNYSPSTSHDEPPSSYLWTLLFLAQYYSHVGQDSVALSYVNSAIAHTPTLPELHMHKARILKRGGAISAASHAMEDARLLDGQDRFLNSKDAKYKLRNGEVSRAEEVMGLFTKPDAPSPLADLIEMQAIWFILEEGKSYHQMGNLNLALKRYAQVEKIFDDHWDDQLDFHSYCVRKFTMRDYAAMCKWEDEIRGQHIMVDACQRAVTLYIALHDHAAQQKDSDVDSLLERVSDLSLNGTNSISSQKAANEESRKRAKAKADEEARKKAAAAAKSKSKNSADAEEEEVNKPVEDADPLGLTLLQCSEPLQEAERLVRLLQRYSSNSIDTWLLVFEVGLRSSNWLLCGKSLIASEKLMSEDKKGEYEVQMVQFLRNLPDRSKAPEEISPALQAITEGLKVDVKEDLSARVTRRYKDTGDVLTYLRSLLSLDEEYIATKGNKASTSTLSTIVSTLTSLTINTSFPLSYWQEVHLVLSGQSTSSSPHLSSPISDLQQFKERVHAVYPLAEEFSPAEKRDKQDKEREKRRNRWNGSVDDEMNGMPLDE
ncbi:unnamed protein product [Sympodiomycopsis kandeliae]